MTWVVAARAQHAVPRRASSAAAFSAAAGSESPRA